MCDWLRSLYRILPPEVVRDASIRREDFNHSPLERKRKDTVGGERLLAHSCCVKLQIARIRGTTCRALLLVRVAKIPRLVDASVIQPHHVDHHPVTSEIVVTFQQQLEHVVASVVILHAAWLLLCTRRSCRNFASHNPWMRVLR